MPIPPRHLIQTALEELLRGRTSFVIAHRLSTIRHADQVLALKDGQIIERGAGGNGRQPSTIAPPFGDPALAIYSKRRRSRSAALSPLQAEERHGP